MARQKVLKRSLFTEFRQPWQRGLAVAFGLTLGLIPKFGVLFASLTLAVFCAPVSLSLCFVVAAITSLLSPQLAGLRSYLGTFALSLPQLQSFWEWAYQQDLLKATGFSNDQTMGSFLLALLCFYPSYFLTTLYYQRQRLLDGDHLDSLNGIHSHTTSREKTVEAEKTTPESRGEVSRVLTKDLSPQSSTKLSSAQVDSWMHQGEISEAETLFALELKSVADDVARLTQSDTSQPTPEETTPSRNSTLQRTTVNAHVADRQQTQDNPQLAPSVVTARQYEEQQWVLDTLIEIIRLREETEGAGSRSSSPSATTAQPDPSPILKHNLLAPLAGIMDQEERRSEKAMTASVSKEPPEASKLINQTTTDTTNSVAETETTMEKLIRTDSDAQKRILTTIAPSDRVENLATSTPSPMNVVPHGARPRSMHSRDESLRFLIHHLQCLQRERGE